MTELRVVVVEDEPAARRLLVRLLSAHADIRVVGTCSHGLEAVSVIRLAAADLVFLDVKMPELDAFGVIEAVGEELMPPVVFITAFDDFAVRAFDVDAIDYLVKPFSDARFEATLERARRRLVERAAAGRHRFLVKLRSRSVVVASDEIDWIEAQDYYALLHVGAAAHLVRQSIRSLEARLDARRFTRINRSSIVNLDRVRQIDRRPDGSMTITLEGGSVLPVSRRRRDQLARLLANLSAEAACK
jgi:two-component system LytT family response regulator